MNAVVGDSNAYASFSVPLLTQRLKIILSGIFVKMI